MESNKRINILGKKLNIRRKNKVKRLLIKIIIFISFISLLLIENINTIININKANKAIQMKQIKRFEKSLKKIEANEIQSFRLINSYNILIDKKKYSKNDNPDITVVLTMFNQAHCIHKALRSIQNQSLKNIEILVILDCSNDNSTETIQKYMEEDERIRMINHYYIEGTMKIRSEGIKLARGKYITALDGDDAFIQKDILNNSLYVANLGDLDIVEFYSSYYLNNKFCGYINNYKNIKRIIYQPELRTKFFKIYEKDDSHRPIIARNIWGKIVKNEIFKKAIDNIGIKYTDDYITVYEDTMMSVSLFQVAQSFYFLKQEGLYYSQDDKSGRYPVLKNKICKERKKGDDSLKFLHFLMENLKDNKLEKQIIYHEMISINYYNFSNYLININNDYEMLYSILDELYKNKYITEVEKKKIIKIKNEVKDKEEKLKQKK